MLDVGANVGVAAVFFALVYEAEVVHSFEPAPETFRILAANLAPLPSCVAHRLGLASKAGSAELTYYPDATAMSGLHADRLADAALVERALMNRGDLLKIDVEKAELDVLAGIEPGGWGSIRQVAAETHGNSAHAVAGLLERNGFHVHVSVDDHFEGTGLQMVRAVRR